MEDKNSKSDDDSDVIMIENIPETISLLTSPKKKKQNRKKQKLIKIENIPETISLLASPKKKKQKGKKQNRRTVKLGLDHGSAMENLLKTQRMQDKRAKFRCIININSVCKQKSDSIIRYSKNEWKKEAYYDRIVPICSRNKCFSDDDDNMNNIFKLSCCGSDHWNKENTAITCPEKTDGMLSPISSIPLTEELENISFEEVNENISYEEVSENISYEEVSENISYEEVSENISYEEERNLSSSGGELDRLIKRTKEREKIHPLCLFSEPVTSTPIHDLASTSDLSLHSLATLVLTPVKTEAYSPTIRTNYVQDSPTMAPDFIKIENEPPVQSPYSPTHPTETPPKYELEKDGRVINPHRQASRRLKFERDENSNRVLELVKEERIDIII